MSEEMTPVTEEYPAARPNPPGTAGRILAWCSGAATVAMVLLALIMLGAVLFAVFDGGPGPYPGAVVVHVLAAVVCVVLQRFADRYPGRTRALCSWLLLVLVAVVFVLYWWF